MNVRVKSVIVGVLLLVALAATIVAAVATFQAIQRFRQEHALTAAGDVSTIRPWMTVPFIAHTYHVPENYLYQSLHITDPGSVRRATLGILANRFNRPVDDVIHNVQKAILAYRRQHPRQDSPTPSLSHQFTYEARAPGVEREKL